jgi:transposase
MEDSRERRAAIVELRLYDCSVKVIAGYLGIHRSTVYRTVDRRKEEGMIGGLEDKPFGRPAGVRKVRFAAIEALRRLARGSVCWYYGGDVGG